MNKKKPEQRNIFIALATFTRLQKAYYRMMLKRPSSKAQKKSEFYTEIIEKGLGK